MKIIQSLNTFGNDDIRKKCGFTTLRAMLAFLERSYGIHSQYDYLLYTDIHGYEMVKSFIKDEHIEIIDFPIVLNDRVPYIGKFQVQQLQSSSYIHVDIDAILYDLPEENDIICEKLRPIDHGRETARFIIETKGLNRIVCSGIIGFCDIDFKNKYITKVYECLGLLENSENINIYTFITIEEVMLMRMILDCKKNISVCKNYFHLQGKLK